MSPGLSGRRQKAWRGPRRDLQFPADTECVVIRCGGMVTLSFLEPGLRSALEALNRGFSKLSSLLLPSSPDTVAWCPVFPWFLRVPTSSPLQSTPSIFPTSLPSPCPPKTCHPSPFSLATAQMEVTVSALPGGGSWSCLISENNTSSER